MPEEPDALLKTVAANNTRQMFVPEDCVSTGAESKPVGVLSMSKNGDHGATQVVTPAPSRGARGGTRSAAGVSGALRRGAVGGTVGTNAPTGTTASTAPACKIHNVPRRGNHHPCQQFIRDFSCVALRLRALKLKGVARVHPRCEFFKKKSVPADKRSSCLFSFPTEWLD
ncbi:intraflagellar transport protein 20 homolog isoform X2 [Accipiter gentilis]|uniref:intraflagellar transport protein 20 homolog isoform X2 n=1 Tax=Astur gentilis TaxID=8957 RepID=UPI00210F29DC|nr:intraflagellar transport protein 20 homolog isoform X2 [Accipiter gentilis]